MQTAIGMRGAPSHPWQFPSLNVQDAYVLPVFEHFLLYAPLHGLIALLNGRAISELRESLQGQELPLKPALREIATCLARPGRKPPGARQGPLAPAFLGLLSTRGCNLACGYCAFGTSCGVTSPMSVHLAKAAVTWYMDWVRDTHQAEAEIHFFGGEPFCAPEVLDISVHLARLRAKDIGCRVRFEVATNGVLSEERARWAADWFDTLVLSCDGPPDIQDRHRGYASGLGSSPIVGRTARIFAQGNAAFYVRSCITRDTVARMPEIAHWLCQEYAPKGVCFEAMQPSPRASSVRLEPPDPSNFGRNFVRSAQILAAHGVEPVYATADLSKVRVSFCPAGNDAVIVSPDGTVAACYLLPEDWEAHGLNLAFGRISACGALETDEAALQAVRALNVWNKAPCVACVGRWHCAGGCHVNHPPPPPGHYDGPCIQTRIITLCNLLDALSRHDLVDALLADDTALHQAICQPGDLLMGQEGAPCPERR